MPWLPVVLAGHLANAGAFVVDKVLLQKAVRHPTAYVVYVGTLGLTAFVLLPFGSFRILPPYLLVQSAVSGATFTLALLGFFSALQRGEATRIVPLFGAFVPIWTMALAAVLLGERLTGGEWWGVAALIVGAVLISYEPNAPPGAATIGTVVLALAAAGSFALSATTLKAVFNGAGFLNGFLWTRLFAFCAVLPLLLSRTTRRAVFGSPRHPGAPRAAARLPVLFFFGQACGALGFILLAWGTDLAPRVTIVNALQGVQYAFLFLLVVLLGRLAPGFLRERLTPAAVAQKTAALLVLAVGLALVAA